MAEIVKIKTIPHQRQTDADQARDEAGDQSELEGTVNPIAAVVFDDSDVRSRRSNARFRKLTQHPAGEAVEGEPGEDDRTPSKASANRQST